MGKIIDLEKNNDKSKIKNEFEKAILKNKELSKNMARTAINKLMKEDQDIINSAFNNKGDYLPDEFQKEEKYAGLEQQNAII